MADVGVEKKTRLQRNVRYIVRRESNSFFFFNINCCRSRCLMATFHVVKIILVTLRE